MGSGASQSVSRDMWDATAILRPSLPTSTFLYRWDQLNADIQNGLERERWGWVGFFHKETK